ncbi:MULTISPECIES: macro domain-containing protein [Corallococcus]|uniref:macro domain-containing protein n=1 Tax=Corallococcus TaxID=83461 RepID=UPI00117C4722|nr:MULTISPECIES: macro domain-containing protein [Corallococcus]NBD12927.1 Appr-1-p processing protein [Corallococcus silvisoli]TSC21577.1 Appr-1-p processing protein [Corallococcus sp. Z5C101001]
MLPEKIYLMDLQPALVRAWDEAFEEFDFVAAREEDFFSLPADAMVSPANSFGIMDGGLDLAIRDTLGLQVQDAVQRAILEEHHGELPVGAAVVVASGHERWPFLVAAPTMRIPENVSQTVNAYLAFRAVLLAVKRHNARGAPPIRTLVCPGLGTGIGGLEARRCAVQMRLALKHVMAPARIPSFRDIHLTHRALRTA